MLRLDRRLGALIRLGDRELSYWTTRALVLCAVTWSMVAMTRLGATAHDLLCAEHGAWPLL